MEERELAESLTHLRVVDGAPVAKDRYLSSAFMDLEMARLWRKTWLLAAHVADLPEPGSTAVLDCGRESVVVVNQPDGTLAAFHNVCQHRGNRLCPKAFDCSDRLVCGYHGWTYGLDGALMHVPDQERFPGLDPGAHGLRRVSCDVAGGFVFVNLDRDAAPLSEFLSPVLAELEMYDLGSWQLATDSEMLVEGNWKLSSDVNNEAYHLANLHPKLLGVADDTACEVTTAGPHSRLTLPVGTPSERLGELDEVPEVLVEMLRDAGLDPSEFQGRVGDARPALAEATKRRAARDGLDLGPLDGARLTDNFQISLFPNVQLNLYANRVLFFRHRPHPSDPERCWFDQQVYVRVPAGKRKPRPARTTASRTDGGDMMQADLHALESVARGMRSSGFTGLLLSDAERPIRHLHESLDRCLFDG